MTHRRARASMRAQRRNSKGGGGRIRFLVLSVVALTLLSTLAVAGLSVALVIYFSRDLPSTEAAVKGNVFQSTFVYDRNGVLLYEIDDPQGGRRQVVPLKDIPANLIDATLATEDATFYQNPGFDPQSIIRAFAQNLLGQHIVSGASTITQQLVRNTLMDPKERYDQSYVRKIQEVILAYQLSQQYSKDQILDRYLNEIYYGNLAYGIEAAAQSYFGKSAKDLDLAESAMLAGLPAKPADYNPLIDLTAAKERQAEVLDLMVYHNYISRDEAERAKEEPLKFAAQQVDIKAPHFVMYVRELLEKMYGREKLYFGGLRVYTTLDYNMYLAAKKAAQDHIATIKKLNANNAAVVTMDPKTGEILAMVGSVDYSDPKISGEINMAVTPRQPGSALKPFNYAMAFAKGLYPASVVVDQPTSFPGGPGQPVYQPHNYDLKWHGPVTLRDALAQSLNIPAVLVLQRVGVKNFLDDLHNLGITTLNHENRYGLPLTLGGGAVKLLDLAFAYCSLANGGVQVGEQLPVDERQPGHTDYGPVAILKVTDSQGKVLDEYHPAPGRQVIDPKIVWMITNILSDDVARTPTYGPHSVLNLSRPAAAKTGTTDDSRDAWTMGYTPNLVTGVWVGNDNDSPMDNVFGGSGAGNIWHDAMEAYFKAGWPSAPVVRPPDLIKVTVYAMTNQPPYKYIPVTDWFIKGTVPHLQLSDVGLTPGSSPGSGSDNRTPYTSTVTIGAGPTYTSTVTVGAGQTYTSTSPFLLLLSSIPPTPTPTPTPQRPVFPTPAPGPSYWLPAPGPVGTPGLGASIVAVPNVLGLTEAEARARIDAGGLNNTYANYQGKGDIPANVLQSVPPGCVLSQTPAPGTMVPRGTTVYLAIRKN